MLYFQVEVMHAHVGRSYYLPTQVYVFGENAKDAAKVARWLPGVKHHDKNAVLVVQELTYSSWKNKKSTNPFNAFLNCKSIQDQRKCFPQYYDLRLPMPVSEITKREEGKRNMYLSKTKIKHQKRFFNNYYVNMEG